MAAQMQRPTRAAPQKQKQVEERNQAADIEPSQSEQQLDAKQPLNERLRIRKHYRAIRDEAAGFRDVMLQPTAEGRAALRKAMEANEEHFSDVKMPREGALDTAFLAYSTRLLVEQSDRLNSGFQSYDASKFMTRIKHSLSSVGNAKLLNLNSRLYTLAAEGPTFMIGPLVLEIKQRRSPQARAAKDTIEEEMRPEDINDTNEQQKSESTKRAEEIYEALDHKMNFWKFVFDPDEEKGFGRTIENIFHSSFLIHDGLFGIQVDHQQPLIEPTDAPSESDMRSGKATKKQCIIQFDYEMWKSLKTKFENDAAFLKPAERARSKQFSNSVAQPSNSNGSSNTLAKQAPARTSASSAVSNAKSKTNKRVHASMDSGEDEVETRPTKRRRVES